MERREVLQIKPTNQSDGVYSFNNGAPQIEFDIPRVPKIQFLSYDLKMDSPLVIQRVER